MSVDWRYVATQIERFLPELIGGVILIVLSAIGTAFGWAPLLIVAVVVVGIVLIILVFARSRARKRVSHPKQTTPTSRKPITSPQKAVSKKPRSVLEKVVGIPNIVLFEIELDTDFAPFDEYSQSFEKGDTIWVVAQSQSKLKFNIFICDEEEYYSNQNKRVHFEFRDGFGKESTTRFKRRLKIPNRGKWFFCVWSPYEVSSTRVLVRVELVSD